jgi:hypothetical protein
MRFSAGVFHCVEVSLCPLCLPWTGLSCHGFHILRGRKYSAVLSESPLAASTGNKVYFLPEKLKEEK